MNTSTHPMITRPGGYSAKNTRRAGAPNTHLSGENPMVTTEATVPTVAQLQTYLMANTRGWLTSYPHMSVSFAALAALLHELITNHTAELRAERDAAMRESSVRGAEILELIDQRDRAEAQLSELDVRAEVTR